MEFVYKVRIGRDLYSAGGANPSLDNPGGKIWTRYSNVQRHLSMFTPNELQQRYPEGFEIVKFLLVEVD